MRVTGNSTTLIAGSPSHQSREDQSILCRMDCYFEVIFISYLTLMESQSILTYAISFRLFYNVAMVDNHYRMTIGSHSLREMERILLVNILIRDSSTILTDLLISCYVGISDSRSWLTCEAMAYRTSSTTSRLVRTYLETYVTAQCRRKGWSLSCSVV